MSVSRAPHVPLADRLLSLAQEQEPTDAERYVGYSVNEQLFSTWVAAATRLRDDADAPLPNSAGNSHRPGSEEVRRGVLHHQRGGSGQDGAKPPSRPPHLRLMQLRIRKLTSARTFKT